METREKDADYQSLIERESGEGGYRDLEADATSGAV